MANPNGGCSRLHCLLLLLLLLLILLEGPQQLFISVWSTTGSCRVSLEGPGPHLTAASHDDIHGISCNNSTTRQHTQVKCWQGWDCSPYAAQSHELCDLHQLTAAVLQPHHVMVLTVQ